MKTVPRAWQDFLAISRRVLTAVFGRWHWDPPAWVRLSGRNAVRGARYLAAHPRNAALLALLIAVLGGALYWYASRPKPHYVAYGVVEPALTEYDDNGIKTIHPMTIIFAESAAPLVSVNTKVTAGISLSPAVAGTWFWANDKVLQFTPAGDWPVDGEFSVRMAKSGLLRPEARLEKYGLEFRSRPFAAQITESQFYQDPVDPKMKKLVATIAFSHPVDRERFESRVSLLTAKDAGYLGLAPDSRNFTVTYDKFMLAAFVHSAPLAMPRDDTPMTLRIDKGVRAARGGNDTGERMEAVVTIPGRASLRVDGALITVADNARYEPEQILLMSSSSPVAERAFDGKISAFLLPERHPQQPKEDPQPYDWNAPDQVGAEILALSRRADLSYVPSDEAGGTRHGFRFSAPVGRYLFVKVEENLPGIGGYVTGKPWVCTVRVPPYPRALKFLGDGSLLPLAGDRRVGFLTRDIPYVRIDIGRVLPNQLQHLAPEMYDFTRPSIWTGMEDRLVERFVSVRDFSAQPPGKPKYESIDIGQYLQDQAGQRRGLFLLHLRSVRRRPGAVGPAGDPSLYDDEQPSQQDTRLILATDLGFIVKQASDGSRDVFVQSIRSGLPVEGARVDLLGANGLPALSASTDASGRARLPAPPVLRGDQMPRTVAVTREADFSFLPLSTGGRTLEISRFDTGGVENARSGRQLSAYLYSDRGIYRPGETAHLGMILRTTDWQASLTGLPIDVDISDARGQVVSRTRLNVSAGSFDEVSYDSPATAPTGTYEAAAYLASDERHRVPIGSTAFRVQEFEPDRLKARLELTAAPIAGWLRPGDVAAKIIVAHLFGEPAANRRIEGELSLTPTLPRFTRHPDYRFQIGEVIKEPYHEQLAAATTDAGGTALLSLDLKRFVGRAYRLTVLARAYEAEGGRNVAVQESAIVADAPFLVGVKPDGDLSFLRRASARSAHWLAVDQQLTPVAAGGLTLEWVQRKYVSVLTQQRDGTMRYVSRLRETVRNARRVEIAAGGTSLPIPSDEPGDFNLVLRDGAGAVLNTLSYTVAGQANLSRALDRDSELQVRLDKAVYRGGDTIEINIRAPYVGAGLITIERERVFRHQWFKTATTSSVQRITLPEDFEGNGYVSVQFVRDPGSDELFMSPLSYGVAAFGADLSARTQALAIEAPALVKPGETLKMRITPGEASRVAVLAVDEGILQVARYRNPDPLGYFFQKRMLEVETRQILDLILPEFQKFLAMSAPGGDAEGGFARQLNPFTKKRKPAVAYWSGVIDVGREGKELTYAVPDYFNGRLRIVAVAANPRRIGVADAATEARADFILTPNVPGTAAPGDEFLLTVGVFNNVTGEGPIRLDAQPGAGLSLLGPAAVDLHIPAKKEGVAEFRVRANAVLGPATVVFRARRARSEARIEESVGIRPAAAYRTTLTLGRMDRAGAAAQLTRDLYKEKRTVEAALSLLPLVWGRGLTAYLKDFEHTCTEQLVSKGIGALVLLSRPEFGTVREAGKAPLEAAFSAVRGRMNQYGGLGLWTSSPETAEFPTVYAAHFLIEAKERGQAIPEDVLANLTQWLTQFAGKPAGTLADARLRAYAAYLLVRQGVRPNAALSNVEQELAQRYPQAWPTDLAAAYLASTYRLMQRAADADRIVARVAWSAQKRDFGEEIYYDAVVHDAQLLYLLAKHFPDRLGAAPSPALETMSAAISGNQVNSLSAAYTLLALDAFARGTSAGAGLGIREIGKDGRARPLTLPDGAMPKVSLSDTAARVEFSKSAATPAYYAINESGFDRNPPAAELRQGVEIIREFIDGSGNLVSRVTMGEEFFVRVRVRALDRDRLPQIAIVDLLPGGVEPVLETRPAADSSRPSLDPAMLRRQGAMAALPVGLADKSDWVPAFVDMREDRIILYGDAGRDIGTFVYRVRANNAGRFQVPPAFAEGLYNRTIVGLSRAGTLEVVKP